MGNRVIIGMVNYFLWNTYYGNIKYSDKEQQLTYMPGKYWTNIHKDSQKHVVYQLLIILIFEFELNVVKHMHII